MMVGRAAALAVFRRKQAEKRRRKKERQEQGLEPYSSDEECWTPYGKELPPLITDKVEIRKWPLGIWFAATFIVLCSIFVVYYIHFVIVPNIEDKKRGKMFKKGIIDSEEIEKLIYNDRNWIEMNIWQILILIVMMFVSFLFYSIGFWEKLLIYHGEIVISRKNILCQGKTISIPLRMLKEVTAVKRGKKENNNNTIHYKVKLEFHDRQTLLILETADIMVIKQRLWMIKTYLGENTKKGDLVIQ